MRRSLSPADKGQKFQPLMSRAPAEALLRLRHNPFFDYLADRSEQWLADATPASAGDP